MRSDEPEPEDDLDEAAEQDLLVVLKLSNRMMGTQSERLEIEAFATELEDAVTEAKAGEYDGDELGGGECILFFCGPDIERLIAVLQPMLKRSPMCRGGYFVRMVEADDGEMVRQRIPI